MRSFRWDTGARERRGARGGIAEEVGVESLGPWVSAGSTWGVGCLAGDKGVTTRSSEAADKVVYSKVSEQ